MSVKGQLMKWKAVIAEVDNSEDNVSNKDVKSPPFSPHIRRTPVATLSVEGKPFLNSYQSL